MLITYIIESLGANDRAFAFPLLPRNDGMIVSPTFSRNPN